MQFLGLLLLLLSVACGRHAFDTRPGDAREDGDATDGDIMDALITDVAPDVPTLPFSPDLWFKLDEGGGMTLLDSGPGQYNAALTGSYTWRAGALHFTQGQAVTAPLPGQFRTYPLTVSAWVTPDARNDQTSTAYGLTPYPANAVSNDVAGVGGFGIGVNVWTDGTPGSSLRVGWVSPSVTQPFVAGTRYHIVLAYQTNQSVLIYINGTFSASRGTAAGDTMSAPLYLGAHNQDAMYLTKRYLVGELDDVRVYRRLLSATDVATLFAAGPD